jgi:hypothetical protein
MHGRVRAYAARPIPKAACGPCTRSVHPTDFPNVALAQRRSSRREFSATFLELGIRASTPHPRMLLQRDARTDTPLPARSERGDSSSPAPIRDRAQCRGLETLVIRPGEAAPPGHRCQAGQAHKPRGVLCARRGGDADVRRSHTPQPGRRGASWNQGGEGQAGQGRTESGVLCTRSREDADMRRPSLPWAAAPGHRCSFGRSGSRTVEPVAGNPAFNLLRLDLSPRPVPARVRTWRSARRPPRLGGALHCRYPVESPAPAPAPLISTATCHSPRRPSQVSRACVAPILLSPATE